MTRALRTVFLAAGLMLGTCATAAASVPPADPAPPATNDFIPEDANLTDCLGSLQRPDCGSESKGGYHFYLVLAALTGGLTVIGWRIAKGVRAGDRQRAANSTASWMSERSDVERSDIQ